MASNYFHMLANATQVAAAHPCILRAININTKGSAGNQLIIYDTPTPGSGVQVAGIDTTSGVGTISFGPNGIQMNAGLLAILQTGTPADITLVFD